jgi:hypothetical protein
MFTFGVWLHLVLKLLQFVSLLYFYHFHSKAGKAQKLQPQTAKS